MSNSDAAPLAIFDLDGTLTDTRDRNHLIEQKPKQWDRFFFRSDRDKTHPEGLAALATAVEAGLEIVYLSGRPERIREISQEWLRRHNCPEGRLLLRSDRDRSSSADFKLRQLRRLAKDRRLALLVDDDPAVVEAVRQSGLVEQVYFAQWQPRQVSTPFEDR